MEYTLVLEASAERIESSSLSRGTSFVKWSEGVWHNTVRSRPHALQIKQWEVYTMKCYFTFGQVHTHSINGKTLDKDCVAEMSTDTLMDGHMTGMKIFDAKFHHCSKEVPNMDYYPRGIINID